VQALGMAIVVEYENRSGAARWLQPSELLWNYEQFCAAPSILQSSESPILIPLLIEPKFRGHGAMEAWTINGKSFPDAKAEPLIRGRRYRLQFINKSADDHPLHLHRHSFEIRSLGEPLAAAHGTQVPVRQDLRGVVKDVVLVDAQTRTEVEFTADNPGASLFHCHQQNHMDLGFMMLFDYA
jgi:FtsP/CotA-like multicopper oxidase with cupredoxin domain